MQQIHRQEKEQFKKLFQQEHIDRFEDRFHILEIFLQTEEHLTADELIEVLEGDGYRFSADFVRDTLKLMCRFGFASKNRFDNGVVRYEHRHLGQHHDHMVCTKCKRIFEFQNNRLENLQLQIAASQGFHMLQHRMEIYGICSDCLRDRTKIMPLGTAKQGERLVIKEIIGGSGARMRLLTMGLRIGDKVEVVTNQNRGQMVIAVDFKRFVLGKGLAEKILVEQDA
jgi:Fur family ferric uptake transcriptional regulator